MVELANKKSLVVDSLDIFGLVISLKLIASSYCQVDMMTANSAVKLPWNPIGLK